MAFYHLLMVCLDIICNLAVDSIIGNSAAIFVFFLIQTCGLVINLISYVIGFSSQTLQTAVSNSASVTQHHGLNLVTIVSYSCLTLWWYIWNIQRSWPTVADQFNFDFGTSSEPGMMELNQTNRIGGPQFKLNESVHVHNNLEREYATVWSSGFIALYTIQRTTAILYYMVFIRNATLYSFDESRRNTEMNECTPAYLEQVRTIGAASLKRSAGERY